MDPSDPLRVSESSSGAADRSGLISRLTQPRPADKTKIAANNDPLSQSLKTPIEDASPKNESNKKAPKVRTESLTIRVSDESRIVAGVRDASKKHTTGSIFTVKVDISKTGTLGIGVKDLSENLLAVSMLKRSNGMLGAGEAAGIRLGDIIFGINFLPTREGSRTLLQILKRETEKGKKYLHLQCWRCHQLCSDAVPGTLFPKADDMYVQAYSLFRNRVFSEWERWNFVEILLSHMIDDLKCRAQITSLSNTSKKLAAAGNLAEVAAIEDQVNKLVKSRQILTMDLEKNILQAKGLRTALCVRIVHTKAQGDATLYVLRVEDVETGLQWVVHRRYRDFHALHEELAEMSQFTKDVAFPKKRISIRSSGKLIENRIVSLEQYIRRVLHIFWTYATMDPQASRSLRHLQNFLGVDKYIDCIHPPVVDDQRVLELMAYRYLNDFASPACQQCLRFVTSVDLESISLPEERGYEPVLKHISQALAEVEHFVMQQHQQQMMEELRERREDMSTEERRSFIRKCVRRQVEAAVYLPLRRTIFRIVYSYIAEKAQKMQRALAILQQASPEYFTVDPSVLKAKSLSKAVKSFRDLIVAHLPADQGQLLMRAAAAVAELHNEILAMRKAAKSQSTATMEDINKRGKDEITRCVSADQRSVTGGDTESEDGRSRSRATRSSPDSTSAVKGAELDLTHKNVLADPVQTMFACEETMPENRPLQSAQLDEANICLEDISDIEEIKDNNSERFDGADKYATSGENGDDSVLNHRMALCSVGTPNDTSSSTSVPSTTTSAVSKNPDDESGANTATMTRNTSNTPLNPKLEQLLAPISDNKSAVFNNEGESDDEANETTGKGDTGTNTVSNNEIILDQYNNQDQATASSGFLETPLAVQQSIVSADDFLPLFTYVLVQAALPQLLLVKELMVSLVDDEETFGECGYYLATLEASTQHIADLADNYEQTHKGNELFDNGEDMYQDLQFDIKDLTR